MHCVVGSKLSLKRHFHLYQIMSSIIVLVKSWGYMITETKVERSCDILILISLKIQSWSFQVSAEIQIIPSKRFIELKYIPAYSKDETVKVGFSLISCRKKTRDGLNFKSLFVKRRWDLNKRNVLFSLSFSLSPAHTRTNTLLSFSHYEGIRL